MTGLGAAMQGGNGKRQENDFYPTPPEPVEALLRREGGSLKNHSTGHVWEPCCGDGAIARVLAGHGFQVSGTDIAPQGFGGVLDFLKAKKALAPAIVTNPPYGSDLPEKMLRHAMKLKVRYVAFLLKTTYWSTAGRLALWSQYPPAAIYPLTWRVDFLGLGAPTMDVMWVVWRSHMAGSTDYKPLPRPSVCKMQQDIFAEAAE